jgi:hypothetical protein
LIKEIEGFVILLVVIRKHRTGYKDVGIAPLRINYRRHDKTGPGEPDHWQEEDL